MSDIEALIDLINVRKDSTFDGECHLSNEEADEIITALTAAPAGDWTVSASETARMVLDYLGIGSDPSLEPGADRRRDNVAKIITSHQAIRHQAALRAAEERGYERGLRDARAELHEGSQS